MKQLYLLSRILVSPLEAIYAFLIFIIAKELNATGLQLSILACTKPTVSLFSAYANRFIIGKPQWVKPFLLLLNLLGSLPCFFFPFIENNWFFIVSYAAFMAAHRASYPAWIEILKTRLEINELTETVAKGSSINYLILTLFPLCFTYFFDKDISFWKYLFLAMACLQFCYFFILLASKVVLPIKNKHLELPVRNIFKEGWTILRENVPFMKYQILFFFSGAGLVAIQPILPIYFNETLHLSYTQLALAFSVCRGISFICSTPFFVSYIKEKGSLYSLNAIVNTLSTLFIVFILIARLGIHWLFIAYLMYGAMQAGCELSWNLSGPLFSKNKESISYSSLNLCFVSIRGMIFPFLGQLIYFQTNPTILFSLAGILCLISVFYGLLLNNKLYQEAHLKLKGALN